MAGKKKKRLNLKRLIVFILILYLLITGAIKIYKEPIKNIIITGNYYVTDNEIIELAKIKNYPAMASLNIKKIISNIKTNKLITDVKIKRNLKFQLIIDVTEQKIICLNRSTNKLLLADGNSINNDYSYPGIPTLINYTKEDVLKRLLKEMGKLDYGIISGISEIEYSPSKGQDDTIVDETRFLLKMNDGNKVYINTSKLSNLKYYQKIYASLNNKKGILHLDSGLYLEETK